MNKRQKNKSQKKIDRLIQDINVLLILDSGVETYLYRPSILPEIDKNALKRFKKSRRK